MANRSLAAISESLDRLEAWLDRNGLEGYDPYDALAAPLLRRIPFRAGRIAATQLLRRFPRNLRPLFGVKPTLNAKGLALLLTGSLRRGRLDRARTILGLLPRLRSPGEPEWCFGYPFDWQSRAFLLPAGTPNVVVTAFAGHALLDARDAGLCPEGLERALSCCRFFLARLRRDRGAFSYSPLDATRIHNASMLAASLLARAGRIADDPDLILAARDAARDLLRHQRPDGSWRYAETDYQSFVDNFHTGFVLLALRRVIDDASFEEGEEPLLRGARFYRERFFEGDGTPRYYADRTRPIDVHAVAQSILTLDRLDLDDALLAKVVAFAIGRMQDPEGWFYSRLGRLGPHRIAYLRWGQAWMYEALSTVELRGVPS